MYIGFDLWINNKFGLLKFQKSSYIYHSLKNIIRNVLLDLLIRRCHETCPFYREHENGKNLLKKHLYSIFLNEMIKTRYSHLYFA